MTPILAQKQKAAASAFDSLEPRYKQFVLALLTNRFNATDAARQAGYSCPGIAGFRLLRNANIRAALNEQLSARLLGKEQLLDMLCQIARGNLMDVVTKTERINWT